MHVQVLYELLFLLKSLVEQLHLGLAFDKSVVGGQSLRWDVVPALEATGLNRIQKVH